MYGGNLDRVDIAGQNDLEILRTAVLPVIQEILKRTAFGRFSVLEYLKKSHKKYFLRTETLHYAVIVDKLRGKVVRRHICRGIDQWSYKFFPNIRTLPREGLAQRRTAGRAPVIFKKSEYIFAAHAGCRRKNISRYEGRESEIVGREVDKREQIDNLRHMTVLTDAHGYLGNDRPAAGQKP